MWIIHTALLCSVAFCTATRQEYGLCAQAYLVNQYCTNNGVTTTEPGIVIPTNVEEKMNAKIREIEKKFESKFAEYEAAMNESLLNLEKKLTEPSPSGCHKASAERAKVRSGTGGVFDVFPSENSKIEVFCDLWTDGGGWTVFQRRSDGSQNFSQDWSTYVAGFGDLTREFWLGLDKLHLLTQDGEYELRVELTDIKGKIGIATYQTFSISGSSENYKLHVRGFSGAGLSDELAYHNNMAFTTKDRDNDKHSSNCAQNYEGTGGWWFNNCFHSMLNKAYGKMDWGGFLLIKKTEMKFRKK